VAISRDWMKLAMLVLTLLVGAGAKLASLEALIRIRQLDRLERMVAQVEADALLLALAARQAGPRADPVAQAARLDERLESFDAQALLQSFEGNAAVTGPIRQLVQIAAAESMVVTGYGLTFRESESDALGRIDTLAYLSAAAADGVHSAAAVRAEGLWMRVLALGGGAVAAFLISSLGGSTWAALASRRVGGFVARLDDYAKRLRQADADKARAVKEAELAAIARSEAKAAATLDKLNEALALAEAGQGRAADAEAQAQTALSATRSMILSLNDQLRVPLEGVRELARTLTVGSVITADDRRRIESVELSGDRLEHLAATMVDLARLDQGAEPLVAKDFRPEFIGDAALAEVRPMAPRRGLTLRADYAEDSRAAYMGDARRISQTLVTLLQDAVEATPRGEIELRFDERAAGLLITVRDGGLTPDAPAAAFETAALADHPGRALAREMVRLMGGEIWAEAGEPRGTVINVLLPLGGPSSLEDGRQGGPRALRHA
jgi:signal transduction histidine kinase